jgi:hypothetical protein
VGPILNLLYTEQRMGTSSFFLITVDDIKHPHVSHLNNLFFDLVLHFTK